MVKTNIQEVLRWVVFILGVFLLAITYNLLMLPYNLVDGGIAGLAIVLKAAFNWDDTIFIYASRIGLLIISFLLLGKEKSLRSAMGSILYPLLISFTKPLCAILLDCFDITDTLLIVILAGIFYGVSSGIIYKTGYTTGGGDIIMQLLSKYFRINYATSNLIYSFVIILACGFTFGIASLVYSLIIVGIANIIIDKIEIGLANGKVFFISTHKPEAIKKLIVNKFQTGYTVLESRDEDDKNSYEVLMCALSNREFYDFKNSILALDKSAFFVINDCYQISGGKVKGNKKII